MKAQELNRKERALELRKSHFLVGTHNGLFILPIKRKLIDKLFK